LSDPGHDGGAAPEPAPVLTRDRRRFLAIAGAALALAVGLALSVGTGALAIDASTTLSALAAGVRGRSGELTGALAIVWTVRVPRALMAAVVGACLGGSGAAMQGIFVNPLADPYLLGVASGASLGATLALTFAGRLAAAFVDEPFTLGAPAGMVPVAAFAGALFAVALTMALAKQRGRTEASTLLLSGVVVGSILISLTTYLMLRDADRLRAVISWTLGSFSWSSWAHVGAAAPYALVGLGSLFALARGLDVLQLGEDTARTLLPRLGWVRLGIIAAASLSTAAAVAFVGVIGFVGLVAPHVMRRLGTPDHRTLLPASALAGAALLVLADLLARTIVRPSELPVGVVTTLLGGPFFLWLLRRRP
jgi:iron complex transport system permease protein